MPTHLCPTCPAPLALPRRTPFLVFLLAIAMSVPGPAPSAAEREGPPSSPSFVRDVQAILSRAGCNAGACHGNAAGKGGFRLSLRAQDSEFDYDRLVREAGGRRLDPMAPDASLILLKPSGQLPHGGGVRLPLDSDEFRILRQWIAAGAPAPDPDEPPVVELEVVPDQVWASPGRVVELQVTAAFADGSRRDVTDLAVYETSNLVAEVDRYGRLRAEQPGQTTVVVRYLGRQAPVPAAFIPETAALGETAESLADSPANHDAANNYIDGWIGRKLERLRIRAAPRTEEHVFLRRVYLDTIGVLPTAEEARRFCEDTRPDKRERLIDHLLSRPEFADYWALKWADLLRAEEKVLDPRGVDAFHGWIRESLAAGRPLDAFVRDLLTATGSTYDHPPANFWRANRDPSTRAEVTARLFLGYRLQCAQCHNHPFDRWTQDDYYRWSAVFAGIDYEIIENERTDKLDKNEFRGEQIVRWDGSMTVTHPRTGAVAAPALLGDRGLDDDDSRLEELAEWMTSPDNDQFARTMANWTWYHLMGRGLVEPVDDFRITNPPSHPELLDALAADLIEHDYRLRHLVRRILLSEAYQRSSQPDPSDWAGEETYARAIVRRWPAEVILDAQSRVLGLPAEFNGFEPGRRAVEIPGVRRVRRRSEAPATGDRFLATFGKPERLLACECERSNETSMTQVFLLIGGEGLNGRLADRRNRLHRLARESRSDEELIRELYWTALQRPPAMIELEAALELLAESAPPFEDPEHRAWAALLGGFREDRQAHLQDLTWALLNAKEFLFRY